MLERDTKILIAICIVVRFLCDGFDIALLAMILFLIGDTIKSIVSPTYGKFGILCSVAIVFISVYLATSSMIRMFVK